MKMVERKFGLRNRPRDLRRVVPIPSKPQRMSAIIHAVSNEISLLARLFVAKPEHLQGTAVQCRGPLPSTFVPRSVIKSTS